MRLEDRKLFCLERLLIHRAVAVNVCRIRGAICSLINRGCDLFPFTMDIHGIVSTHVETVCLLSRDK